MQVDEIINQIDLKISEVEILEQTLKEKIVELKESIILLKRKS